MNRIESLGFAARQAQHAYGTDLESCLFDSLNDSTRVPRGNCIGLDNGECAFHVIELYLDIAVRHSRFAKEPGFAKSVSRGTRRSRTANRELAVQRQEASYMTAKKPAPHIDEDEHIGAVEGDRPSDRPNEGNPSGPGVDREGLPNDPIGTAQDEIGANLDETEG
jgi:hypothetical protein